MEEPGTGWGEGLGVGSYGSRVIQETDWIEGPWVGSHRRAMQALLDEKALGLVAIKEAGTGWVEGPGVGSHRRGRHWLGRRPWGW